MEVRIIRDDTPRGENYVYSFALNTAEIRYLTAMMKPGTGPMVQIEGRCVSAVLRDFANLAESLERAGTANLVSVR